MLDATIEGRHVNLFKKVIILLKKGREITAATAQAAMC